MHDNDNTPDRVNPSEAVKARAMRLLVSGESLSRVAELVEVSRPTVRAWRDSPEGQRLLRDARAEYDREFKDTVSEARTMLKSLAQRAVEVLDEDLTSEDADIRHKAAKTILDRVGLPRTERLEIHEERLDLSSLSDTELAEYERLRRKALGQALSDSAIDAATAHMH